MSDIVLEPQLKASVEDLVKDLCKVGLYQDALFKAESEWGPIDSWDTQEKCFIAIRLYTNLGGDRKSDALLLNRWRKNRDCPELLIRILFYRLNKSGPIIANELLKEYEAVILKEEKLKPELLGFKSIIQKIFKNYSEANSLLDEAIKIAPADSWITSLKIQLLSEQNEFDLAKVQAEKHFDAYPSPYNMRVLSGILTKIDGVNASIALYKKHVEQYQSAYVWVEYAQLLAGKHDWPTCEYALEQFEKTRIIQDKQDEPFLISWKGQIAIHYQNIEQAIETLASHKGSYWKIVTENLKLSKGVLNRKVLDVPFLRQEHMTCAPTTLAALCSYWGHEFNSKDIADAICFDGTPATKERQWLSDNNFYYKEFELDSDLAYSLIENDIPFALVTTNEFSAHIQAVIGFNKQVGTLYVMDPSQSLMQEMLTKETIESEAYSGARCIAFVPAEKSALLSAFNFPASSLYPLWDEYSRAEEQNDYLTAKLALEKLISKDPDHRITLRVERSFAAWNNDTTKILELNNKLLERFPDETILLNSKYFCLRGLGKREEGLKQLSEYLENNINVDLLGTLFDEIYDTNEHKKLTLSSLAKLKYLGCYSAYSHWSIANYYWSKQSFDLAAEHYLYAYCLDETSSQFIESYFKASRFLNKAQESITFLKERFDKYKIRSAMPAISLYKAYDLLDQEHIGIDYLFEALDIHSDDTNLINYLSNTLIERGLIDRFTAIENQIKPYIAQKDFDELIARKNIRLGEFDAALKFFQDAFNENPFIHKYADNYFELLSKIGDIAKIDSILEDLHQKNPQNTQILDYIADWHSAPVFQEQVLTKFVELRPDYGLVRRQLIDVRLTLGMFEQALQQAKDTCENFVGEHINESYLAKCHLKLGNFEAAKTITRDVLSIAVDNDLAFSSLMTASVTKDEQEASLDFVFSQMKKQVIFGNSAWDFWFNAKSIFNQEKLKIFIDHLLNEHDHLWYTYSLSANYYQQYGDLDKAKALLLEGQSKFPLTPRLYSDLGKLYELEGDTEKSIAAFNQALVMNPAWSDVTKRLCDLLEKHEDIESAIAVIQKGLKHNSNDGTLHGYLADLLIKQGNDQAAIESLKNAVKYNTDYRWAWNQLSSIAQKLGENELTYDFAKKLAHQSPYLPHVWRDLAYLTKDQTEKFVLYDKSLNCDLYFIPVYLDKIQYFVEIGEYKSALNVLDRTPWKNNLPLDLTIQKVDLLMEIGQKKQAIQNLKEVLFNIHGYAYLWKKLFDLLEQEKSKSDFIDCSHKSVEQNRYDADILCYAGENLLKYGNKAEKESAQKYLKKAFDLSPNEQYIVMTYVDSLIESQKYEDALDAIKTFELQRTVAYATTRKIGVLCKLGRFEQALEIFKKVIVDKESDYWHLNQCFITLNEKFSFEALANLFKEQIKNLTIGQAYFYTDKCLNLEDNNKYKHVLADIKGYSNKETWEGAFLALLDFWRDKVITPPDSVIDLYFSLIITTPSLISQLSNGYINVGHYHSLIKLFENTKNKQELPAYVFYHYRLALQMLGKWDEAGSAIEQGLQQQPDNTIHNMRLWYAYELIRTGQQLTQEDITVIDYEELMENEQYVYSTLRVVLALADDALEHKMDELTPLLRKCQQVYQATAGQSLAMHAQKTLKKRLKSAINTDGFFKKIKLNFWLSNRF
ncbi:MAG: tetratricopeptide repeat protein [Cognaticolwellia sp.]